MNQKQSFLKNKRTLNKESTFLFTHLSNLIYHIKINKIETNNKSLEKYGHKELNCDEIIKQLDIYLLN